MPKLGQNERNRSYFFSGSSVQSKFLCGGGGGHSHVNRVRPSQMGSVEFKSASSYVKHTISDTEENKLKCSGIILHSQTTRGSTSSESLHNSNCTYYRVSLNDLISFCFNFQSCPRTVCTTCQSANFCACVYEIKDTDDVSQVKDGTQCESWHLFL